MCSVDTPSPPPPVAPPQAAKAPAPRMPTRNPLAPVAGMAGQGYAGAGLLTGASGIPAGALNVGKYALLG